MNHLRTKRRFCSATFSNGNASERERSNAVTYMLPVATCARQAFCYSVTSLILATTSYYSRLIEHEKFEITTSHPPFTAIFARKRRQQNAKKMNYESRNIMLKMLIWICSILPCLVICDAFISQINLGLTIDCCNLNCSIVNQSSCKLCSSTLTRISFNYSRMFLHYLFTD